MFHEVMTKLQERVLQIIWKKILSNRTGNILINVTLMRVLATIVAVETQ